MSTELETAARDFVDAWALSTEIGTGLTCAEADTLATLFRAAGDDVSADSVMEAHGVACSDSDRH